MEPLIHILYLEDDLADAELVQEILESAGLDFQITRVQTGEEFAAALRQGGFDVILADYRLPKYDGMSALHLVQELGLEVPFIFVSGTMGEDAAVEGLKEGATDYVLKHKLSRLAPAIERALRDAENRRERQRAEEELRESVRRNQLILDSLPGAALLIRANMTIVASNKAAVLAGAAPGRRCYDALWELGAPCFWCEAQEALQTGKPLQAEIEASGKAWEAHWIPINSDLFFHFVYDITERKEAEQERAKLREQLFQAQKMEAIGTLAGGIAHDFNNILSAILGYGEMLELFHSSACPEIKSDVQEILKAAFRAKDLVQQILTFGRRTEQDRKPIKLQLVTRESLKFLRASLPSTIEIIQSLDPEVGPVLADPTQMQQVVMNLCTNAAHAMREKGGVLEVRLTEVVVEEEHRDEVLKLAPGSYAQLTVKDSGHGIPPEILDRIFDPYFTTKGTGEGTGLGLAVVEGIVRSHGGAITVESEPGVGTAFRVFLPILERKEIALPSATISQIPKGQGRVLFVDDEPTLAHLGQEILENLGYEVEALTSSAATLEHFLQQPQHYDLAILDLTMPQMTGVELAQEILQIRPDLPIILASGFAEQISQEELKKTGIRDMIKKPFSVRTLAETIKKVQTSK